MNEYKAYNTSMFPAPLTREQEAEAVRRAQAGDAEARDALILHNMRLVVKIARKYAGLGYPLEELVSIGTIGLIKGVDYYRPDSNARVSSFAAICATTEMLQYLRRERRQPKQISLDAASYRNDDGDDLTLVEMIAAEGCEPSFAMDALADREMLQRAVMHLRANERAYIEARFMGEPQRQSDVARTMGISQSYASRIEKRALRKMREQFEQMMNEKAR